ncbi:MAG: 1-deoxy-D-xylulose-5-phosphate synthase, partial [Clostridiales bacterium]|nr:1-deoxy-D-xylulose-5-phosphate synthase [Clostridiales bacterium]
REIRDFLVDSVSKTGGHLASNLGVVELTVALHRVFSFPEDKIIFDVGHQSYVHKLLTGRRELFPTLRRLDGMSGFPKRSESDCDAFNTGHSSTSVSSALGIAVGQAMDKKNSHVIALFGDGALTGGMMFEALNMAGQTKMPLVLILNDNNMSISKNVGAMSKHLRKLRISPFYFKSKQAVEEFIDKLPRGSQKTKSFIKKIKTNVRRMVIPTTLFDDLGILYIGPIDGHDIDSLISCLEYAKDYGKPVLLHVLTKKGMGYAPAMQNPSKFHGIGAFDADTGEASPSEESYSSHFGKTLCDIAKKNDRVVAITAAMKNGTGLDSFAKQFKNRFFDVAIAEQHGVTFAAGLATTGHIPVIPLYSSFLQRAYDQTLHDVCLQNLHVVFPIDRAGIVGADGETHQGIYDISYLSHMPNMCILSPSSFKELDDMLDYAINTHNGPIAIRYPRGSLQCGEYTPFKFAKAVTVREGRDVSIIATGRMAQRAMEVYELAKSEGISCEVIFMPTVKPLDEDAIIRTALKTKRVITIEDNVRIGGMGAMIADVLKERGVECKFKIFALPDEIIPQGTVAELDERFGLSAKQIEKYCR